MQVRTRGKYNDNISIECYKASRPPPIRTARQNHHLHLDVPWERQRMPSVSAVPDDHRRFR